MSLSEDPPEAAPEVLLAAKDRILATKPFVESLPPGADLAMQRIVAGHYDYLVGNGVMTPVAYQNMWDKCVASGDFSEMAIAMSNAIMARQRQYLADHPDLHQSGDAINPGVDEINGGMAFQASRQTAIRSFMATPGNQVAIDHIGSPPLREAPDWILYVEQQRMPMSDVYAALEG